MTGDESFGSAERRRLARVVRGGAILAIVCLAATTLNNMSAFEPAAAVRFSQWALLLAINLFALVWWTRSHFYPTKKIGDLIVTLPIVGWFWMLRDVIISQNEVTRWTAVTSTTGNYLIAFVFASVLFPANFAAYLAWTVLLLASSGWTIVEAKPTPIEAGFAWSGMLPITLIVLLNAWSSEKKAKENYELKQALHEEKAKSEEMLFSILPEDVARRLRAGEVVADSFAAATVVFIDIVGSSTLARNLSAKQFLATLNAIFGIADDEAERHGVEKVKTIGDAYLAVLGARVDGEPLAAIHFAQAVARRVTSLAEEMTLEFGVRVGIHSGPVVGGVIGQHRAIYDYWGDTMNVAARLESVAPPGGVTVSKQTYFATKDRVSYLSPRTVVLKGIGEHLVYDVDMGR